MPPIVTATIPIRPRARVLDLMDAPSPSLPSGGGAEKLAVDDDEAATSDKRGGSGAANAASGLNGSYWVAFARAADLFDGQTKRPIVPE